MRITRIDIHNYRNLDGVSISLEPNCNFIVGENNIGKSNLLSVLNTIFSYRAFSFEDFKDYSKPIEVLLQLNLQDVEIGLFQDLFELDDYHNINILCQQLSPDDSILFYHSETSTFIQSSSIKCANFIYYDSLRNPVTEINFDKSKGVGKFLKNIIAQYLTDKDMTDKDFLYDDKMSELLGNINTKIIKIKSFKDFQISANSDDDIENLLSKIVLFKDSKGYSLSKAGYGVQFVILITLSILERIYTLQKQRKDKGVFEDSTGKKSMSLIIALDEPEIHLHPYMQRSLIKYINSILSNKNTEFKELIKELFDIDELIGQLNVVTHSPNIILNDYKQIIRFYTENGIIKIVSGSQVVLDEQYQKHLYLHFPFIKEAFFSRTAIFVEGDSEFACLPLFGLACEMDFDDYGICVIQARGITVPLLMKLVDKFGVPSVGITDLDNGSLIPTMPYHYQTQKIDFEDEIVSLLLNSSKEGVLRSILCEFDSDGDNRIMQAGAINKKMKKYEAIPTSYSNIQLSTLPNNDPNIRPYYLTWFSITKSYPLGKLIGERLQKSEIPRIYKLIIYRAKKLAENV